MHLVLRSVSAVCFDVFRIYHITICGITCGSCGVWLVLGVEIGNSFFLPWSICRIQIFQSSSVTPLDICPRMWVNTPGCQYPCRRSLNMSGCPIWTWQDWGRLLNRCFVCTCHLTLGRNRSNLVRICRFMKRVVWTPRWWREVLPNRSKETLPIGGRESV